MTSEIISGNECEVFLDAIVGYGEVKCVDVEKSIGTNGLYSCLGLILMDNRRVALAHIPSMNVFCIFRNYDENIVSEKRTYEQLMNELFEILNPINMLAVRADIVGGTRENSSFRVEKIKKYLKDRGIRRVRKEKYNTSETELNVYVLKGKITTVKRKRPYSYGETSY